MFNEILQQFVSDPEWQNIQEMLKNIINARILWLNNDSGDTIESIDENYHDLCKLIRSNSDGLRRCQTSHYARFQDAKKANSPILSAYYCGLMGFAVPIVCEDQAIGVIEGYIPNSDFPITVEKCAEISVASDTDIKEVMDYAKGIKHITKAEQRMVSNQLSLFAGMLPSLTKWISKSIMITKIESQYSSYLSCLSDFYDLLKGNKNINDLLKAVNEKLRSAMSVDASSVYILDSDIDELSLISTSGLPDSALGQRIKVGEGIVGYVAQTQAILAVEDATLDPRAFRVVTGPSARRRTYRSVLSVPLIAKDKLIGVIDARTFHAKSWTQSEISFLTLIAKYVTDAIISSELYRE